MLSSVESKIDVVDTRPSLGGEDFRSQADDDILVYNHSSSAAVWVRSTGARGKAWNCILYQLRKFGVPNDIRGSLWLTCSGALWELRNNPGYYKRLTDQIEERFLYKAHSNT